MFCSTVSNQRENGLPLVFPVSRVDFDLGLWLPRRQTVGTELHVGRGWHACASRRSNICGEHGGSQVWAMVWPVPKKRTFSKHIRADSGKRLVIGTL